MIFTSRRRSGDDHEYARTAGEMVRLAAGRPGFLGMESARDSDGLGITVSYWTDEAAIAGWKNQAEHLAAQRLGREKWYQAFRVRVARVERDSAWEK